MHLIRKNAKKKKRKYISVSEKIMHMQNNIYQNKICYYTYTCYKKKIKFLMFTDVNYLTSI